jgi:hypothetical protein
MVRFSKTGQAIISFFEAKDLTTAPHEIWHIFRRDLEDLGTSEGATHQAREDWRLACEYVGVKVGEKWNRQQEEKWAKAGVKYLLEGRAPSPALRGLFHRIKKWLYTAYDIARDAASVNLSPEIRGVFDRMIAMDDEIELATNKMGLGIDAYFVKKPEGISAGAWAKYHDSIDAAYLAAEEAIQYKMAGELDRLTKEWKKQAWEEAGQHPDQQLIDQVVELGGINSEDLGQHVESTDRQAIGRKRPGKLVVKQGGDPLMIMAANLNMSESELVSRLVNAPSKTQLQKQFVDERKSEWAKTWSPEEEVITDEYLDMLEQEELMLRMASGGVGLSSVPRQALEAEVRRSINNAKVGSLLNDIASLESAQIRQAREARKNLVAAVKATRGAERAQAVKKAADAKSKEKAAATKRRALKEQREYLVKTRNYFKRVVKNSRIEWEYREQIIQLLEGYDPYNRAKKTLQKRESLREFVQRQIAAGEAVLIPDRTIDMANRKSFSEMTMDEVKDLRRSVEHLEHLGKLKNRLITSRTKKKLDQTVQEIVGNMAGLKARDRQTFEQATGEKGWLTRLGDLGDKMASDLVKIEFLTRIMDGGQDLGPAYQAIMRPAVEAENKALALGESVFKNLDKAFEKVPKTERNKWTKKRLTPPGSKISLTREQLIMVALNAGNKGNHKALVGGFNSKGYGWTDDTVQWCLDRLSPAEWDLVKDVAATVNGLWPLLNDAHRTLTGIPMKKVEGWEVSAAGLSAPIPGWYFPIKWDKELSLRAEKLDSHDMGDLGMMFRDIWAHPKMTDGFTKDRQGGKMPVRLSSSVITRHLYDTIQYATHAAALRDIMKVANHPTFAAAVETHFGKDTYRQFRPWLVWIARPHEEIKTYGDWLAGHLRRNTTLVMLGLKASVALKQTLSYTQTIDALGVRPAMRGVKRFYAGPQAMIKWVNERSVAMRTRRKKWDRELKALVAEVKPGGKSKRELASEVFMYPIGIMDAAATYPTWLAAYEVAQSKPDQFKTEQDRIEYADMIVRTTQPTASPKDLSAVQRGSEFQRAMTMFYTFFSVAYNRQWMRTRAYKEGQISFKQLMASYWWLVVLPAYLGQMINERELLGPSDAALAVTSYLAAGVPWVRDVVGAMTSGYDYTVSPVAEAGKTVHRLQQSITAKQPKPDKITKNLIDTLGYAAGIPSKQINITLQGMIDLAEGETQAPEGLVYLALPRKDRD